MVSDRANILIRRDGLVARVAALDRGETSCRTVAAIGSRNHRRSQLLVTFLPDGVASAPRAAQNGRIRSNSKCQDDGEN